MSDSFRALVVEDSESGQTASFRDLTTADLPDHAVLVEVEFSSLNYKDGLVVASPQKMARTTPLIAGADLAGTVVESIDPAWSAGDRVVVNGWGMSETQSGGYTRYQRVKPEWLVRIPEAFSTRDAMAIGTAGYTSALCLDALDRWGIAAGSEVLVTGAAGGVGSVAVALASAAGHVVVAATGRPETHHYLTSLGASAFIERAELQGDGRPMGKERWDAAIDSVGGSTLVNVLAQTRYGGAVAACGLVESPGMPHATVLPHILRGVGLLGVDSVSAPQALREKAWQRLARDLPPATLNSLSVVEPLSDVPRLAAEILDGQVRGRVVIDVLA
ncbi:MAG: MDR family oxidoreductase [Aeromicrobium sp.]|uniref:MDR family oxidoreductase n=1 Tax=Aeromicrobium sp. TaxID=1871063 RepID=UPI003C590337